ncbi:type II toxin-antitoxin system death-on-curing family toxin [Cellulomonas sp. URHB0016]
MTSISYPDENDVEAVLGLLALHARDAGLIGAALARPQQVVFGHESYDGLHLKAAALLDSISRSHPLYDGNKRLAWLLAARFYDLNGYALVTRADDGDAFMRMVAGDDHPPLDQIARWLEDHAVPDDRTQPVVGSQARRRGR